MRLILVSESFLGWTNEEKKQTINPPIHLHPRNPHHRHPHHPHLWNGRRVSHCAAVSIFLKVI